MNVLSNLGVAKKLWIVNGFAVACMLAVAILLTQSKRAAMEDEKRISTQHVVQVAHGIVQHFHQLNVAGTMSEAQAKQAAIAALRALRYGNQDYLWINDMRPYVVMHPMKPELDGKDAGAIKDPDGKALFVQFVDMVKEKGAGHVEYLWPKPGLEAPVRKVSYVQGFAPWGWVIGTGIYIDDVDAAARADLMRMGLAILALSACFVALGGWVRSLAQRSAAAAKEIKGLITDSVDKVDNGTRLVGEAGKTMDEIVSSVKRVTDIMAEIAAASQEQSSGIEQVNQAVMQMDDVTQQNAALVEQSAAAAESLQEQARNLGHTVEVFKIAAAPDHVGAGRANARTRDEIAPSQVDRGPLSERRMAARVMRAAA